MQNFHWAIKMSIYTRWWWWIRWWYTSRSTSWKIRTAKEFRLPLYSWHSVADRKTEAIESILSCNNELTMISSNLATLYVTVFLSAVNKLIILPSVPLYIGRSIVVTYLVMMHWGIINREEIPFTKCAQIYDVGAWPSCKCCGACAATKKTYFAVSSLVIYFNGWVRLLFHNSIKLKVYSNLYVSKKRNLGLSLNQIVNVKVVPASM